jgi:DNA polymerase (family 10)
LLDTLATEKKKTKQRLHLHHAWNTAERVIEYLKVIDGVKDVSVAGELRRWKETVGSIDIVASTEAPERLLKKFQKFPMNISSSVDGPTCRAELADGVDICHRGCS